MKRPEMGLFCLALIIKSDDIKPRRAPKAERSVAVLCKAKYWVQYFRKVIMPWLPT